MATLIDIIVPEGQQEGTESTLTSWLKQAGDAVTKHEPLIELETDKVVVEVAAPESGILAELLVGEGDMVEPGALLGRIEAGAVAADKPKADKVASQISQAVSKSNRTEGHRMSPAVRRLLKKHDIDPAAMTGSGRDGRITHSDVQVFLGGGPAKTAIGTPRKPTKPAAVTGKFVPHTQMRRRIAQHLADSMLVAPHVTSVFEADLSAIARHRAANRKSIEKQGAKLTYTAYFVAAAAKALKAVPEVNSRFHEDGLELFEDCHIGVGTALGDEGLIVPVIRAAQDLSLEETALCLHELIEKARSGGLDPTDVQGGTFTISNHGVSGSLIAAPIIINQPQTAILGIGKLEKRVTVIEKDGKDTIEIRPMCFVTLSIDHRALDAHQTNRFLTHFVNTLEGWG